MQSVNVQGFCSGELHILKNILHDMVTWKDIYEVHIYL